MSWWNRLRGGGATPSLLEQLHAVRLTMQGWSEETTRRDLRVWRDPQEDVLSLSVMPGASFRLPDLSDETAPQRWSRNIAESRGAGLIEVRVFTGTPRVALSLIFKRLEIPAYIFTGQLIVPRQEAYHVWTIVAGERGTTGVREAVITAELMEAGKMTLEDYERSWGQDPYASSYRGVDGSVLRFISDDERYDERFPGHPLSKIRRVLATLASSVLADS